MKLASFYVKGKAARIYHNQKRFHLSNHTWRIPMIYCRGLRAFNAHRLERLYSGGNEFSNLRSGSTWRGTSDRAKKSKLVSEQLSSCAGTGAISQTSWKNIIMMAFRCCHTWILSYSDLRVSFGFRVRRNGRKTDLNFVVEKKTRNIANGRNRSKNKENPLDVRFFEALIISSLDMFERSWLFVALKSLLLKSVTGPTERQTFRRKFT